MSNERAIKLSKFLSYVLRHRPDSIGISLDKEGWVEITQLISNADAHGTFFTLTELREVVADSDKQRFTISEDGQKIRAAQGHSTVTVKMTLAEKIPPSVLYHGTAEKSVLIIKKEGLKRMNRHHVHLSALLDTAISVGGRHGKAIVLEIDSFKMHEDGFKFYQSENGVWLTDSVPSKYISQ